MFALPGRTSVIVFAKALRGCLVVSYLCVFVNCLTTSQPVHFAWNRIGMDEFACCCSNLPVWWPEGDRSA